MALPAQNRAPPTAMSSLHPPSRRQGVRTRISPQKERATATHWNPLSLSPSVTQAMSSNQNGIV